MPRQETPCQLIWVYAWSGFCISTPEDLSVRLFPTKHVKDQVLRNVFGGILPDRIFYRVHIVKTSCCQFPARSWIFCLQIKVTYWPCGLRFLYPTINLIFLRIIVKVKHAKFCLHNMWWRKIFYLSCPRLCDRGFTVVRVYKKKNTTLLLLLVLLLSVTWVPCISRHPI